MEWNTQNTHRRSKDNITAGRSRVVDVRGNAPSDFYAITHGVIPISYIQKHLGRASLVTVAIYTEKSVESLRQVLAACHPAEKHWHERGV
jgi:hypothetical protein